VNEEYKAKRRYEEMDEYFAVPLECPLSPIQLFKEISVNWGKN
jgi:hypothetical protein